MDISRHRELFDPNEFNTPIHIIGAGALGSWIALYLAKLGIKNITIYDFDKVEPHNVPNQAFGIEECGCFKVDALEELILRNTGIRIKTKNEKVDTQRLPGIVFMAVDSMEARKSIFNSSAKMKSLTKLYLEGRMGIDSGRVYTINPTSIQEVKRYEDTFYSDDEAQVSACGTSQSVITSSTAIAAIMVRQMINFANEEELDNEILIDFKYNQMISTNYTK